MRLKSQKHKIDGYNGEYAYICFNIKGIEKLYFESETFINLIFDTLLETERKKYEKRLSFDVYLMKNLNDGCWYITRLGTQLKSNSIKVIPTTK